VWIIWAQLPLSSKAQVLNIPPTGQTPHPEAMYARIDAFFKKRSLFLLLHCAMAILKGF